MAASWCKVQSRWWPITIILLGTAAVAYWLNLRPVSVAGEIVDAGTGTKYMQEHGYRVIPVNPTYPEILGEKSYKRLVDIPEKVDVVDCFRKSSEIPALAEEAIAIGAKVLWMQLGVENAAARSRAEAAGLEVIENRCVKIEHGRFFGGLGWAGVNTGVISAKRASA